MSAYRESGFQPPCARCDELSTWSCEACNEPRCEDDMPDYGPWCEGCEERFGEFVARERLYMVPVRSQDNQRKEQPAYWRWYHDVLHVAVPLSAAVLGVLTVGLLVEGALLAGGITGAATALLSIPAIRELTDPPAKKLERRLAAARRRFLALRSRKLLGDAPADLT